MSFLHESKNQYIAGIIVLVGVVSLFTGCSSSIHDAVAREDTEYVASMLSKDPDLVRALDGKGKTPLHAAVTYQKLDMMPILLENGADINSKDMTGMTPLHVAAMLGRPEEATWLLVHGADPQITDEFGDTPLHTAIVFGRGQIIKVLVAHGIAPDTQNANGETPVAIAKAYRQDKVARYLEYLSDQKSH